MISEDDIEAARAQQLQALSDAYAIDEAWQASEDARIVPPYVPAALDPEADAFGPVDDRRLLPAGYPSPVQRALEIARHATSNVDRLRREYEDAVELAQSIERLSLEDRYRILRHIAAEWPQVVAAAIEDIATGRPCYDYALDLVTP